MDDKEYGWKHEKQPFKGYKQCHVCGAWFNTFRELDAHINKHSAGIASGVWKRKKIRKVI